MKLNENERALEIYFEDLSEDAKKKMSEELGDKIAIPKAPIAYFPMPLSVEDAKQKFIQSIVLGVRPQQQDLVAGITVKKCTSLGTTIAEKGSEEYIWFAEDNYPEEPLLISMKDENPSFDPDMLGHLSSIVNSRQLEIKINGLIAIGNSNNVKLNVSYNIERSDFVNNTLFVKDIIIDHNLKIGSEFFLITVSMFDDVIVIIKEIESNDNSDSLKSLDSQEIFKIVTNPFEYDATYNSARDGYINITNSRIVMDNKQNFEKDPYYLAVKNFEDDQKKFQDAIS